MDIEHGSTYIKQTLTPDSTPSILEGFQFENPKRTGRTASSVWARLALLSMLGLAATSVTCGTSESQRFQAEEPDTFPIPKAELTLTLDDIGDVNVPGGDGRLDIQDKRELLEELDEGCIECADVNGDGKLNVRDTEKLEYRIEHPQNYHNPNEDPNGDGKTDEGDIQFVREVIARFGSEVPGDGVFRGGIAYIANAIEAKKLLPGTSREVLEQIATKHGWSLERTDLLGNTATYTVPDEILEKSTLAEQIDKLDTEEVVEQAGRVVIGTIDDF